MVLFYLALKQKWKVHIKLQFATLQSNAVLLYNGRYNNKNDFVAIQIINGQVQFTVSTGKDAASALTNVRGGVNDGEWQECSTTDFLKKVYFFPKHQIDICQTIFA